MAERNGVTYTGARPDDALSSFSHQTIRTVYVPRSLLSFALSVEKGLELQDKGARGFVSAMGTPALGERGALAMDWRVVTSANHNAKLADAMDVLADNAAAVGAKLASVAIASSAGGVDRAAADRQAAAASGAAKLPTVGATIGGAVGAAGNALESLAVWLVVFAILALIGLYLWTKR